MKPTNEEKRETKVAQEDAARLLLENYITSHPAEIARCIEKIIPFLYGCPLVGLQQAMNTVNATFAAVALDVIKSHANDEESLAELPADVEDMKTAIYHLSRFINLFGPLSALAGSSDPAIKMCQDAFGIIEVTSC